MTTKEELVRVARTYVGMPFRAQGRGVPGNRYATIDCGGLLVCVGEDLNLIDKNGIPFLRSDYSDRGPQPIRDELLFECNLRLIPKKKSEYGPSDVVTLRAPNSVAHCGIISNFPKGGGEFGLIFAYPIRGAMKLVETRLDERWKYRIAGVFSWPGVE